jgi:hypothetical protein
VAEFNLAEWFRIESTSKNLWRIKRRQRVRLSKEWRSNSVRRLYSKDLVAATNQNPWLQRVSPTLGKATLVLVLEEVIARSINQEARAQLQQHMGCHLEETRYQSMEEMSQVAEVIGRGGLDGPCSAN